jgi:hypothetical protein
MMSRPVDSSMRSRQTGQVGSSTKAGVGGARGFAVKDAAIEDSPVADCGLLMVEGEVGRNGS